MSGKRYVFLWGKKVKVKWSRYRPGVAQRVGRGIALLFHDRGTKSGWVVSITPRSHFTPGKDPVPILQEAGWAPGLVWTGAENLVLTGIPSRTVQPVVTRYTNWATRPTYSFEVLFSTNNPSTPTTYEEYLLFSNYEWYSTHSFFLYQDGGSSSRLIRPDLTEGKNYGAPLYALLSGLLLCLVITGTKLKYITWYLAVAHKSDTVCKSWRLSIVVNVNPSV